MKSGRSCPVGTRFRATAYIKKRFKLKLEAIIPDCFGFLISNIKGAKKSKYYIQLAFVLIIDMV